MAATRRARSDAVGRVRVNGRGAEQVGPACAAGPKARRAAHLLKNVLFQILFKSFFIQMKFLNYFKTVSKVGVKMKVVPIFKIYSFAFVTKVQFQIDFELQNKNQY